jgi:antitoxin component of RelBE/YafQ-DinJ toxin-antitoxin module
MKRKLTVTIDEEILPKAKRYARSQGISLSQLIETTLKDISSKDQQSFSQRWRGKFQPAEHNGDRFKRLRKKYL